MTDISPSIQTFDLNCGMRLVVEPMAGVSSVALAWLVPAGSTAYSDEQDGFAALLAELILRGAGDLDARAHSDALDRLGVQRSTLVAPHHLHLHATLLGNRLDDALPLLADMVTAPRLPETALEPARSLAMQTLDALQDDPQELVMLRLRERHLPSPLNRHGHGRREVLATAQLAALRDAWTRLVRPCGSILAVAGAVDADALVARLDVLLDGWSGTAPQPQPKSEPLRGSMHVDDETAQTHIGLAWDAPPEGQPGSTIERVAARILGGGSSSRLFTEVRERRGLVYSVGASYSGGRDTGLLTVYAGSTPDRAQTTVDVIVQQMRSLRVDERMPSAATAEELHRATIGLRSGLVLQGESTSARATALAADLFRIGRPRTLRELTTEIEQIDLATLRHWIATHDPGVPTLMSIGPKPVHLPSPAAL